VKELPIPEKLEDDQFVVKIHAAPINPFDLQRISGTMLGTVLPLTPGAEGSGIIVAAKN